MVTEMVLTVLAAMLLSFLVAKLVSAVIGGGEVREAAAAAAVGAEEGGVVGEKLERVVVDRRYRSEMPKAVAVVYGFGNELERVGGGDEEVESADVEESRQFREISESGLMEVVEIAKSAEEEKEGSGGRFVDENAVRSCLDKVEVDGVLIDEVFEDMKGGDAMAVNVDNAKSGSEEMEEEEINDEVADWIEECIRNIVNEGCENECKETAEAKDVVNCIGLVINSVIEGGEIQFEKMVLAEPDGVLGRIGGVIEEEYMAKEGYKNQCEELEAHKDENVEVNTEVTEKRFGSSKEDDDWEGIEMSELYNEYKSAAAFVRKEEKEGKFSNTGSELKMQLYGFQKIVMEGPCHEAQPMALKMDARAKWYKPLPPTYFIILSHSLPHSDLFISFL